MKLCIDDANVEKIRRIYDLFPVDGELFVQAVSLNAEGMVAEAGRCWSW